MKRSVIAFLCILVSMMQTVSAQTDSETLQNKIAKFSILNTDFVQEVFNLEGKLIQKSSGKLVISRPGNFYWEVKEPEEELIISNGKDLWLYSPFIEQVSIMNFSDAIAGTPFVLLSGANASQWNNFDVKKSGHKFVVSNNKDKTNTNKFTFIFDDDDNVTEFRVEQEQGQKSLFKLTKKSLTAPLNNDLFEFKIPAGVEIDDQR